MGESKKKATLFGQGERIDQSINTHDPAPRRRPRRRGMVEGKREQAHSTKKSLKHNSGV